MRKLTTCGFRLLAVLAMLAPLVMLAIGGQAMAQGSANTTATIERVANQQFTGKAYARYTGGTFEQCQARCLADKRCLALEHNRGGGRVTNRNVYCRLYSARSETRTSSFADVGYKTDAAAGAKPTIAESKQAPAQEAAKKPDEQRAAEERRAEELRRADDEKQRQVASRERAAPPAARKVEPAKPTPPAGATAPQPVPPVIALPAPSAPPPSLPPPQPPAAPAAGAPAPELPASTPAPGGAAKDAARPASRSMTTTKAPPADWDVVPVFYGTDRNRQTLAKRVAYGSDRARRLELGQALVTVPKAHQVPNVERPWAIKIPYLDITLYQESEDPKKHFTIKEIKSLTRDEMLALVRQRLAGSKNFKDQALVVIHGYNNAFDDALYRTAQISYDLKFDGAPFLYSWPSGGGITSYPYDRDSAVQAEQYLSQFLLLVLNETGAQAVNIIAHSMGNQPLLNVLREMKRSNPAEVARINQIILAAPDVDRDAFEYIAGQLQGVGRGITMYVSSNDAALGISRRFAGGVPRAGDVPADIGPSVIAGIDTIDVSALSTDYLAINHSSYAEKSALIQDIELVFRTGERPPENRLPILKRMQTPKGDFWRYPN